VKFKTKPFEIQAIQFTGDNFDEVKEMAGDKFWPVREEDQTDDPDIIAEVFDELHSTWVGVKAGQWIIKGQKGEFYPCDPDIFAAKYEQISEPASCATQKKVSGLITSNSVEKKLTRGLKNY
jgi:hypothetical protein